MKASATIIAELLRRKDAEPIVQGRLGSGPVARRVSEDIEYHKILVPGDRAKMVKYQLYLLLHDLAVDLHLDHQVIHQLHEEFWKGA